MASASKASLVVAASVAAVEALKDQAGLCRWNYALRWLHQRAKHGMPRPFSQATATTTTTTTRRTSSSASSSMDKWRRGGQGAAERAKRTEESLSKLIQMDCWGPKL